MAADPVVSNVRATQLPGTGDLEIRYDLADVDSSNLVVSVNVSTKGGASWFAPAASSLTGAVGSAQVVPGRDHVIVWQGWRELPTQIFSSVKVKVIANDGAEVAWYKMDDNAANRILVDSSVSAYNATNDVQNTANRKTTGKLRGALYYNGTEHAASQCPALTGALIGRSWTIAYWAQRASTTSQAAYWMMQRDNGDPYGGYCYMNYSTGLRWYTGPVLSETQTSANPFEFAAGIWVHFAFVRNGTEWKMYRNGVLMIAGVGDDTGTCHAFNLGIVGNDVATIIPTNTRTLDDFRVYDVALASTDVISLYNEGNGLDTPLVMTGTGVTSETSPITVYDLSLSCVVTFDPMGGIVSPANKIVTFNAVYGELPMPARTGYTFEGWQATTNGIVFGETSNSVVSIASDHTLAASWSANTYTATFNPEGGEVNPTNKVVTFNVIYGELPMPSRTGYTFTGWQTSTNGVIFGVTAATAVSIASHHTLTASWTANTYTVTFNPQGGEVNPIAKTVTFDSSYGELPMPACNGYIFAGWWTGVPGSGTQVTALIVVTADADHALYANWTDDPYLCPPADKEELSSVGSYDGFFFSENDFSDYTVTAVRGTLTLKIIRLAGKLTATVVTQTGSLRFSANTWSETEEDGTFLTELATRGGEALDLHVSQNRVWGKLTGGEFGNEILTLDGARNHFADSMDVEAQTLLNSYRGLYRGPACGRLAISGIRGRRSARRGIPDHYRRQQGRCQDRRHVS